MGDEAAASFSRRIRFWLLEKKTLTVALIAVVVLVVVVVVFAAAVARRDALLFLLLVVRARAGVIGLGFLLGFLLLLLLLLTRRRRALTTAGLSIRRRLLLLSRCLALLRCLDDGLQPALVVVGEAGLVVLVLKRGGKRIETCRCRRETKKTSRQKKNDDTEPLLPFSSRPPTPSLPWQAPCASGMRSSS